MRLPATIKTRIFALAFLPIALAGSLPCKGEETNQTAKNEFVISIVTQEGPLFWAGLLPGGKVAGAEINLADKTLLAWHELSADSQTISNLTRQARQGKFLALKESYCGSEEEAARPPGLPLTRLRLWLDGREHEISIGGLNSAPAALREFVTLFWTRAAAAPTRRVSAVARAVRLSRRIGPQSETQAELYEQMGRSFLDIKPYLATAPAVIGEVVLYPETAQPLSSEAVLQLQQLPGWRDNSLLFRNNADKLELNLWRSPAAAEKPNPTETTNQKTNQ